MEEKLKKATLKTAFHYLEKNPEENIHRIMAAIDKFAGDGPDSFPTQREAFRNVLENPDNNMYQLIMSVLKDIDKEVVKVSLENFFFKANTGKKQEEIWLKYSVGYFARSYFGM